MKKWICLLLSGLLLTGMSGCEKKAEPRVVEQPVYRYTIQQLKTYATAIVVGKVEKAAVETYAVPGEYRDTTQAPVQSTHVLTLKVEEDFKGTLKKGDRIPIAQEGDQEKIICTNVRDSGGYLKEGDRAILFLAYNADETERFQETNAGKLLPYTMISEYQGKLWLKGNSDKLTWQNKQNDWARDCKTVDDVRALLDTIVDQYAETP